MLRDELLSRSIGKGEYYGDLRSVGFAGSETRAQRGFTSHARFGTELPKHRGIPRILFRDFPSASRFSGQVAPFKSRNTGHRRVEGERIRRAQGAGLRGFLGL